jgi:hypothetical protein
MKAMKYSDAGIMAILLLQYKYSRKGLDLTQESVKQRLKELELETGFDAEFIRDFFTRWIIPAVLRNLNPKLTPTIPNPRTNQPNPSECKLAMRLICDEHHSLTGVYKFVETTAKNMSLAADDLHSFYFQYVFPTVIISQYGMANMDRLLGLVAQGVKEIKDVGV